MDITFAILQDSVLKKDVTSSGGGIELGENIYHFLERN